MGDDTVKQCKICKETKPLTEFYTYKKYGKVYYTGRCKPCKLVQNKEYRDKTGYDKKRYEKDKDRLKDVQKRYRDTQEGREANARASRKYRESLEGKSKQRARSVINHGIRDGKITKPTLCEVCGLPGKLEAHHPDYSKPTDVKWLCKQCHENLHHLNEGSTSE